MNLQLVQWLNRCQQIQQKGVGKVVSEQMAENLHEKSNEFRKLSNFFLIKQCVKIIMFILEASSLSLKNL